MNWVIFSGGEPAIYQHPSGTLGGALAPKFKTWCLAEGEVALSPTGPFVDLPTSDSVELFGAAMVYVRDVLRRPIERMVEPENVEDLFPKSPGGFVF